MSKIHSNISASVKQPAMIDAHAGLVESTARREAEKAEAKARQKAKKAAIAAAKSQPVPASVNDTEQGVRIFDDTAQALGEQSLSGTVSATLAATPAANDIQTAASAIPVTTERPAYLDEVKAEDTKPEALVIQTEAKAEATPQAEPKREKASTNGQGAPTGGLKFDPESFEVLRYISEDFVMLTGKSLVAYRIESGDEMCRDAFIQYSDRHYHDVLVLQPPDKDGNPVEPKRVSAGEVWWSWKNDLRRRVRRIVMEPTSKNEADDNPEVLNRWHQLKETMAERNPAATADDITILVNHLMYLSGGDVVGVTYFLCWLAQLYQTPEIKIPTAILMYSKNTRIGKNLMQRLLTKVFGKPLVSGATGKSLQGRFDDAIKHKRLFFINELARSDKVDGYENFKSMVSEEDMQFEGKGDKSKEIKNITHYVVTTNHADALPLAEKDGRVLVLQCLAERQPDAYYKELVDWIDGPGAPALAQILDTWRFPADWDPYAPVPQTAAVKAMQKSAKGELHGVVMDMIEAGEAPFDKDIIIVANACNGLNNSDRVLTRPANESTLGAVLKDVYGEPLFRRILIGKEAKLRRYYVIRNAAKWEVSTPEQRGEHLKTGAPMFAVQQPQPKESDHD